MERCDAFRHTGPSTPDKFSVAPLLVEEIPKEERLSDVLGPLGRSCSNVVVVGKRFQHDRVMAVLLERFHLLAQFG